MLQENGKITDLIFNYANIIYILTLSVLLITGSKIKKDPLPEVVRVSAYKETAIRQAFMLPSIALIFILSSAMIAPYSVVIFRLSGVSSLGNLALVVMQIFYIIYFAYLASLIIRITSLVGYRLFKIRYEDALTSFNALSSILIICLYIWLSYHGSYSNFLPGRYLTEALAILKNGTSSQIAIYLALNAINIAFVVTVSMISNSILALPPNDSPGNSTAGSMSFYYRFPNHYLVLIVKKISRALYDIISSLSLVALLIIGSIIIKQSDTLSQYGLAYSQFYNYSLILIIGIYIMSFDDYDILKTLRTFGGNILRYNLNLIIFFSIAITIFHLLNAVVMQITLEPSQKISLPNSFFSSTLFVISAMLAKTILLNKKSDGFVRVISSYGYLMFVVMLNELSLKISDRFGEHISINPQFISYASLVTLVALAYVFQIFLLKMRLSHD